MGRDRSRSDQGGVCRSLRGLAGGAVPHPDAASHRLSLPMKGREEEMETRMGEVISGDRRVATEALMERAARAASGLESVGVRRGDTVALYLRNDLPFFEASFAAGLLGAYPTPVNWHYTEDEARYLFENSGAKAVVIHADLIEPIKGAFPPGLPVLVVPTPDEVGDAYGIPADRRTVPAGMTDWTSWLEGFAPLVADGGSAPGTIIYTSGTTGRPKGVRRTP